MAKIPDNVEELLKRTETVLIKNWKCEIRLAETRYNEAIYLKFQEFKNKIDNGTSIYLLKLENGDWKSKIEFIYEIKKYWNEISGQDITVIKSKVYKSMDLERKIAKLMENAETRQEAQHLLKFIKNCRDSCWGQMDEDADTKIFRLVTSQNEFSQILNSKDVLNITPKKENSWIQYKQIQIAMHYEHVDEKMYIAKGLYDEYKEFCKEFQKMWDENPGAYKSDIKAFNLWNNVKNTATYYIYIR